MAQIERMHCSEIPDPMSQIRASSDGTRLYMNQFQLFTVAGNPDFALQMQALALETETLYRIEGTEKPVIRLLGIQVVSRYKKPDSAQELHPFHFFPVCRCVQSALLAILCFKIRSAGYKVCRDNLANTLLYRLAEKRFRTSGIAPFHAGDPVKKKQKTRH